MIIKGKKSIHIIIWIFVVDFVGFRIDGMAEGSNALLHSPSALGHCHSDFPAHRHCNRIRQQRCHRHHFSTRFIQTGTSRIALDQSEEK